MFGGVVVAVIDCEAFVDFYRNFNIGPHGSIWLMHEDATLLARQPPIPDTIGKNFKTATFVRGIPRARSGRHQRQRLPDRRGLKDSKLQTAG